MQSVVRGVTGSKTFNQRGRLETTIFSTCSFQLYNPVYLKTLDSRNLEMHDTLILHLVKLKKKSSPNSSYTTDKVMQWNILSYLILLAPTSPKLSLFPRMDARPEPSACGNWVPIPYSSLGALLHLKSASLVYRSLFRQARHRAAWNCIFMNRAEAPYTAIKRECSDISPWQHGYGAALFQAPTISLSLTYTHTHSWTPINYIQP